MFAGKRVLHLNGDSRFGGDTVYLFALADRTRECGGEVHICTTDPQTIVLARAKGYPVIRIASLQRDISPLEDLRSLQRVVELCLRMRYDLVHTHTSKGGAIGRIGARLAGVRCVVHTIQGFPFHERTQRLPRLVSGFVERVAGSMCDVAISVNHEDRMTALRYRIIAPGKIFTVHNGVDSRRFEASFDRQQFRGSLGIRADEILVGCIARMAEQKDPETFLNAARLITEGRPNVRCICVGDGPLLGKMRARAARLGLGPRLLLPGFRRNVEEYLRALDIFVLNSLWEGLPLALVEAMCVGLPIVATDIKGNRECVDESCARLIPPESPRDLRDAVFTLLDQPELARRLGDRARQRYQRDFTQERMLEQTFALYRRALAQEQQPCTAVLSD